MKEPLLLIVKRLLHSVYEIILAANRKKFLRRRASVYGRGIDRSRWILYAISRSTQYSTIVCSFVVRRFAHGAMGHRIHPSWWTHWAISHSTQYSTFVYNKSRGMCYPVCGMVHIKDPSLLIGKSSPWNDGGGYHLSLSEWSFTIKIMSGAI